ncbi:endonuclease/exonuclease/phosphatase family protein [Bacteriovorax sp. Seq25_V]|uniref:endonuclease/exonuclease/phosphatase family protein n=1 Tax=Bacteriovorax sp. Seq25_V TaxID=1201288 RepID=UPI000389ED83|nr:endonuclease/exonuclease/phosphatase family protein [Bacteriovorax sp. Seq25_V]EQC45639.1 endonuclease/exonuclease/phosphatase family protein [Bacteriovorax sp. Seq25_V]
MLKGLVGALATVCLFANPVDAKLLKLHKIPSKSNVLKTYVTGNPSQEKLASPFNILVWNMYKGSNDSWESDFKALSTNANIIISQEMYLDNKMFNVFKTHGDFYYNMATSFFYKGETRTGVATISDHQPSSVDYLRSHYREPFIRTPKIVMITTHPLENGEELLVANIHAINFVSAKKLKHQIKEVLERIKNHSGPVIFAGDFNVWSKKKTKMLRELMADAKMTEVKYSKDEDDRMRVLGKVLDYIFYKNLNLVTSEVKGEIEGADHKPLTATFEVFTP